jgi:hypothetical protein
MGREVAPTQAQGWRGVAWRGAGVPCGAHGSPLGLACARFADEPLDDGIASVPGWRC